MTFLEIYDKNGKCPKNAWGRITLRIYKGFIKALKKLKKTGRGSPLTDTRAPPKAAPLGVELPF